MGKAPAGAEPLLMEPSTELFGIEAAAVKLAGRHSLVKDEPLYELLNQLHGLSCRDQEEAPVSRKKLAERRRDGFALARQIKREADAMLAALERLYAAYHEFDEVVRFNPSLLEAIFDVDTGGPGVLMLPEQIAILQTSFRSEFDDAVEEMRAEEGGALADIDPFDPLSPCPVHLWDSVDARLQLLAALPVKTVLARGPVPNVVLAKALERCRAFWLSQRLGQWTMASLKHSAVRHENKLEHLGGACESFVADCLTVTDIRFSLTDLASAWDAVDKAERAARA